MKARVWLAAALLLLLPGAYRILNPRPARAPAGGAYAPQDAARAAGERHGRDVPVPAACTPEVNRRLAALIAERPSHPVDNVMVCGVTISASRTQRGRRHGDHEILPLLVNLPGYGSRLVEVVANDELDGIVTAPRGAQVFAYGQAFFDPGSRFVAGIHDVHCATHASADNGWVVVNGRKAPASCPAAIR